MTEPNPQPTDRRYGVSSTQPRQAPSSNVPPGKADRDHVLRAARAMVADEHLTPPLGLDELKDRSRRLLGQVGLPETFHDFTAVVLNNETWRETLAGIPYNRRLLLIPQCLKDSHSCPAEMDEFGLLCQGCGRCAIHSVLTQARELGYVTMVAEGSAVVTAMIASGQVEAVVGVSCLDMLSRVFPYMEAGAIPGVAIPLLYDGCVDTALDLDWLWEAMELHRHRPARRFDLDALRGEVREWFTSGALESILGEARTETQRIAADWLARGGKRWRPFLTASTARALAGELDEEDRAALEANLPTAAVAVECFHKASLVHDDIEDDDPVRYGEPALHEQVGMGVALNVGDYLLGEGYRLLTGLDLPPRRIAQLVTVAAGGHHELCLGQGDELTWTRDPQPLSVAEVLQIFRRKTAPAFEVALRVGAALVGRDEQLAPVLTEYSRAIGIAYQIRDDLDDGAPGRLANDLDALRPTLLPAIAHERAESGDREFLNRVWTRQRLSAEDVQTLADLLDELDVRPIAAGMLEFHKSRAIRALIALDNVDLKSLLRRLVAKIFGDVEPLSCCDEHTS
ncbi:MAG: polyprenyl synthetase family protein [Phycisphaerae bacterium]